MVYIFTNFEHFLSFRAVYKDVPYLGRGSERPQVFGIQFLLLLISNDWFRSGCTLIAFSMSSYVLSDTLMLDSFLILFDIGSIQDIC